MKLYVSLKEGPPWKASKGFYSPSPKYIFINFDQTCYLVPIFNFLVYVFSIVNSYFLLIILST